MKMCERVTDYAYKASEMWTIDYLKIRKIVDLDTSFFFTAIVVMATLLVNKKWYDWREKDYI